MPPPLVQPKPFFGRAPNGAPKVEKRWWHCYSPEEIQWEDLTNQEIIVLVTLTVIICVVFPSKDDGYISTAEFDKISELFIEFDKCYEADGKIFKVFYYFNINLDPKTGKKYTSDERVKAVEDLLWYHINIRIARYNWKDRQSYSGAYFAPVYAELPAGSKHSLAANSYAPSPQPPTVHVTRP